MTKHIAVWNTFCEAIAFFKSNIFLFLKGMTIPLVIFITCIFLQVPTLQEAPSPNQLAFAGLGNLLQPFFVLWMGNICYRITLTGMPGKIWWSMAETWTVIAMILVTIVILLGAGIPAGIVYFGLTALSVPLLICSIASGLVSLSLLVYLIARFSLLFPGIAVNEKIDMQGTWTLSQGNGLRILLLMMLPLFIIGLSIAILAGILSLVLGSQGTFMISFIFAQLSSILIFCVNGIALALAYKQLK